MRENLTIIPHMKKVKALKCGDVIGIAAPASPFDRIKFQRGVAILERLGFRVLHRDDIFDQNRYLAGTDKRRAEEFTDLVCNRLVSAIMFARGGYGSQRIIPLLDSTILSKNPKPIIGFSDLTALHTYLRQNCGFPTFYGPVITQLGGAKGSLTVESLVRAITCGEPLGRVPMGAAKILRFGCAKGPIVGGCLSLINSSIGTPYELNTGGAILFIEEIGEKVYVLDRMLTQLKNSGMLAKTVGVIFGSILPLENESHDIEHMLSDVMAGYAGPIIFNYPTGHVDEFVTLPLGAQAELTVKEGSPPVLEYTTGLLA